MAVFDQDLFVCLWSKAKPKHLFKSLVSNHILKHVNINYVTLKQKMFKVTYVSHMTEMQIHA